MGFCFKRRRAGLNMPIPCSWVLTEECILVPYLGNIVVLNLVRSCLFHQIFSLASIAYLSQSLICCYHFYMFSFHSFLKLTLGASDFLWTILYRMQNSIQVYLKIYLLIWSKNPDKLFNKCFGNIQQFPSNASPNADCKTKCKKCHLRISRISTLI